MSWDPELVAAHELGHAIAARETGIRLGDIRVTSSWLSGMAGYCVVRQMKIPCDAEGNITDWSTHEGLLVMTAAGQAASSHWFQLHGMPIAETAGEDRFLFAQDAAEMPNPMSWEEASDRARHIVVSHWDEIIDLTPRLLERGRLDPRQVA